MASKRVPRCRIGGGGSPAALRQVLLMEMPGISEVHVWTTTLDSCALGVEPLLPLLSPDERERADRMLVASHRDTFVLARGTLRRLAGAYLDRPAGSLRFEYSPLGRPGLSPLDNPDGLQFSVSHSGGLVLLAFTRRVAVGVDVERVRMNADCDAIAGRFFAPMERRALASIAEPDRTAAFFACWTRKEALLKAVGLGISRGLARVAVTCRPGEAARVLDSDLAEIMPDAWTLFDLDTGPGFAAAVAVGAREVRLRRVSPLAGPLAGVVPPRS